MKNLFQQKLSAKYWIYMETPLSCYRSGDVAFDNKNVHTYRHCQAFLHLPNAMNKDSSHHYNCSNYTEMLKTHHLTDITTFQDTILIAKNYLYFLFQGSEYYH
jgi:hypothetical protein